MVWKYILSFILITIIILIVALKNRKNYERVWIKAAVLEVIASILISALISVFSSDVKTGPTGVDTNNSQVTYSSSDKSIDDTTSLESSSESVYNGSESISNAQFPEEITFSSSDSSNDEAEKQPASTSAQQNSQRKVVPLQDIKTYLYEGSVIKEDIISDTRGNSYNDVYAFYGEYFTLNTGGGRYDRPWIEKYLGKKYAEFSAKIIPHEDFDKYNKNVEAIVKIYADGNLIYTSNRISRKTEHEKICISVDNTDYLRIELIPTTDMENYQNKYSIILVDAELKAKQED